MVKQIEKLMRRLVERRVLVDIMAVYLPLSIRNSCPFERFVIAINSPAQGGQNSICPLYIAFLPVFLDRLLHVSLSEIFKVSERL